MKKKGSRTYPPAAVRLWAKVDVRGPDDCWLWTGRKDWFGYGVMTVGGRNGVKVHRVSWELHNGPTAVGLFVLHRCDNPPCVNPAHLFLGTQQDNMDDMAAKGRRGTAPGERNGSAKLTAPQVVAIRASTESQSKIGARYGVAQQTVSQIRSGKTWRQTCA